MRPKGAELKNYYHLIVTARHDSPMRHVASHVRGRWWGFEAQDSEQWYFCQVLSMIRLLSSQKKDKLSAAENKDEEKVIQGQALKIAASLW
jgi:hypothetical protein